MLSVKMPRMKVLPLLLFAASVAMAAEAAEFQHASEPKLPKQLDWKEPSILQMDARIAKMEAKLLGLIDLIRPACLDDVPILQRKVEQTRMGIEQARKQGNSQEIARLEVLRDEVEKALDDLTSRNKGVKIEDVAAQIVEVKAEIATLKVERLKKEIEKRARALENIVRVMRTHFFCGNDVVDAKAKLLEARKKLTAAKQAGDNEAAKSAEEATRKVNAMLDELKKPVIDGVTIETISEDITRLKKEKLELEAELERLESPLKTKKP